MRDYTTACASPGSLGSLSQETYVLPQGAFQTSLYSQCPSPNLTLQMHTPFNATRDDKIYDCGFYFSGMF